MNKVSIKKQSKNYINVFKHLMGTYYNNQKRDFWLVQILMGLSVGLGLIWILGLIAGLNNLHDLGYLQSHDIGFLKHFFALPVGLWISILSISGLLGVLTMFISFKIGVRSEIADQKYL
ncbi:MAG: hypothetical protein L3J52_04570, partial [Proteobacteria bacterium]|nr:hypothetical protein [Pseudomonadota bacterium]